MRRTPVSSTASSGANPKNVYDGFLSTSWSSTSIPSWIELDLGNSYDLKASGISISFGFNGNTNLTITAGNTPNPGSTIFNGTIYGTTGSELTIATTAINARYIRIQCNSAPAIFTIKEVMINDIVEGLYRVQQIVGRDTSSKEQIWPQY